MTVATKRAAALAVLLLLALGAVPLWRHFTANEVTRAKPGAAWRVPGGIGSASIAPTVAGVAVPAWFGQRGAPIRRIAGRVTFGGQPVANATVELASALTEAGVVPATKRRTGADGRFDFGTQPPARYGVAATAEGKGPAILEVDSRNPSTKTDQLELRLIGCDASLFGQISDASGGPIAGAQVCLAPPRAIACVSADNAGAYSICLSPRQEFVTVSAPGYGGIYDRVDYNGRRVRKDFALTPEATVVGRVVRADNNQPVIGAAVRVSSIDFGQRTAAPGAATTDAQGRFSIGGLAPGRQRVFAIAEGLAASAPVDVNLEAGKSTGEILVRMRAAARLSGFVTDGRDPIVGATIQVGSGGVPGLDAVTQADGSFVIDPVARGRTTLFVRDHEVEDPKVVTIDRAEVSGVRVRVANLGSVAGRVMLDHKPLPGAQVNCGRSENVYADDQGVFLVRGLPPDKYRCFGANQTSGAFGFYPDFALGKGEHRTGVDIDIKYNGMISGVVVESDGKPLAGAGVTFDGVKIDDHGQDVSAPDGTFHVRSLLGGDDYRPSVNMGARNFTRLRMAEGSESPINVKDGNTEITGVRLVVQRDHLAITGSTLDGDGSPMGDVRVDAFRTDARDNFAFNSFVDHPSATSAADGSFSISDLDAGTYTVQARGGDGSEGVVRGVAAGQKGVVVRLASAGGIDGTLVGFLSQPGVQAMRQIPGAFSPPVFATVDGTTAFRFRGLSPGMYQIAAIGADTDAQMVEVSAGQIAAVTLKSRGSATIHGRIVDWQSGAGVPGLRCIPGLRTTPAMPMWTDTTSAISDDSGAFVLEDAPAGPVAVQCFGTGPSWSNGRCELTATPGQDATCEVPVVHITPDVPFSSMDAQIQPGPMPARIMNVVPKGNADRAGVHVGDIVNSVDGASVTRLTPMGVNCVIGQKPVGAKVHFGLSRGGEAVAADVVMTAQ